MAWFAWDEVSNELKEVPWQHVEHHPDFVYENGVHMRKGASGKVSLWINTKHKERAVVKMQVASTEFRDNYFK